MDWRAVVRNVLDLFLRVPSLFVMDFILAQRLGSEDLFAAQDFTSVLTHVAWLALQIICFIAAACVALLQLWHLVDVYCFLLSFGFLLLSYGYNKMYVDQQINGENYNKDNASLAGDFNAHAAQLLLQFTLALGYNAVRYEVHSHPDGGYRFGVLGKVWTYILFIQPVVVRLTGLVPGTLAYLPAAVGVCAGLELAVALGRQGATLVLLVRRAYIAAMYVLKNHGIQVFLETQWERLHVPLVLLVFWIARAAVFVSAHCVERAWGRTEGGPSTDGEAGPPETVADQALDVSRLVLVRGSETVIALLGMTSAVSYLTHYLGVAMAAAVKSDSDEDRNMGTMCAILFFVLALQTGLTGLEPTKRLVRISRNFCLLFTAMLHFIHSTVHPLLMNASASGSMSSGRHARLLTACAMLLALPIGLLCYLWARHAPSTWLLAVTAFSVEVVIKVIISLLIYTIFMVDAYRETFWEKLDDYIYYIKSVGNTIEFLFGIFLFCNGAWIMMFESGGFIRALMMCIHAYFNIFMQAKEGWKVFMKRRTAVQKINSLPEASVQQLALHNDVCAICYQELVSARVTRCHHYFHTPCLRKWLYNQDKCPLCHKLIYQPDSTPPSTEDDAPDNDPRLPGQNGAPQHMHVD